MSYNFSVPEHTIYSQANSVSTNDQKVFLMMFVFDVCQFMHNDVLYHV